MFKKKPQIKSSSNIKSSERRNLLSKICEEHGIDKARLLKEQELALLPSTTKQSTYHNEDQKGTIYYSADEKPLWFRNRDSVLFPTLYSLWTITGILPVVLTNSFVIERLLDNANLMLPGCIPPFDKRMTKGALVGIACYKTPDVVMAIGVCALNLTQFSDVQGRQGTAVIVKHYFGDELFKLYDEKVTVPENIELSVATEEPIQVDEAPSGDEEERQESTSSSTNQISGDMKDLQIDAEANEEADVEKDSQEDKANEILTIDLDNFFVRSFIQSVKVSPIELPISSSTLMSDYILKNLPRIDAKYKSIKKTSWKKTAKYLKHLEKIGYISLKGKGDDVTVTAITIPNEIIQNFVPHKTGEPKGPSQTPSKKENDNKMTVLNLYKPANKTRMIFNDLDLDYSKFYTSPEIKVIINQYIKKHELVNKKSPKLIDPDANLATASSQDVNKPVSRESICAAFIKNCSPHFTILQPGEEHNSSLLVRKGQPEKIKITTQTVLGRKKITTVVNFEHFDLKPQKLAEDLKNACSGSSAINPCKHNPAIMEVMVQGPHGSTVTEYLKSKGIPIAFIEFEDKSKGKKKK